MALKLLVLLLLLTGCTRDGTARLGAQPAADDGGCGQACDISFASRGGRVSGYRATGEACGWGDLPDLLP